ncbi:YuxK [Paenibacillus mucilaginosus 3016]|uniref:YuxK n=1 Tax=Paenibacillus mucilaginosus 3016 TaxID=1116391 RepID=H6NIR4_9BACL|nr:DCC1-like thiol-disulfide oxidoreductase family protein [Paenibacillus mucilaginosus]AFC33131.1 YuxK [Paenibacillus mucilaginosus 3016]WFA21564.1 thiol-disulfide oxidoreductase DCC family protein [Paenibacillus mucilaginosus]
MNEEQRISGEQEYAVIFYDGVCGFCQKIVQFILPRDPEGKFRFVAIQSEFGRRVLTEHGLDPEELSTFVLLDRGKIYTRSTAGLRVLRELGGLWKLLYLFIIVPRPLRDLVYKLIASNRYRLFGRTDACMLPRPQERARFLA